MASSSPSSRTKPNGIYRLLKSVKRPNGKFLFGALAGGILSAAAYVFPLQQWLGQVLAWIETQGWLGAAAFVVVYILACIFFVPGSLLTLGAGAVYGVAKGFLLVSLASTLGATAAFLVGRYLARQWVAEKVRDKPAFRAIDEGVGRDGWKLVGLTRLSPVFPFNLLNYAYGLTRVSLRHYVLASWIGMMPGTLLYVYLGSLVGNLATLGHGSAGTQRTPAQWGLYLVGLAATLAVTVRITRIAKSALAQKG